MGLGRGVAGGRLIQVTASTTYCRRTAEGETEMTDTKRVHDSGAEDTYTEALRILRSQTRNAVVFTLIGAFIGVCALAYFAWKSWT
jgi:glutamine amidotransferase-like uncharacterized protein